MNILKKSSPIFAFAGHLFDPKRTNIMAKNQWSDEILVKAITGSEKERNNALQYIFTNLEWKSLAIRHVQEKGGNEQDGEDVFQETLILFDRNIREKRFKGESSLKTYFIAIVKWCWWGQFRKRHPHEELGQQHDKAQDSVEGRVIEDEKKHFLRQALKQLGERCEKILELYQLHYSMEEIAMEVGLSSTALAKKEAYRCREKLKEFLDNNPDWKNHVK